MSILSYFIIALAGLLIYQFIKVKMSVPKSDDLKKIISDGAFLVDVRTPQEFASGSAKGAVNIPLDKVASQIDKFKNKGEIVVFCRSGNRSGQAKSILESNGINKITNGGTWENVNSLI